MGFFKSAKFQLCFNYALLLGAVIGWPASALSWAREEPQFVLGLSWMALILTSWGNIISAQVHSDVEEPPKGG